MKVRRVVTGHDSNGKAVFASDSEVEGVSPALLRGGSMVRVWGADEAPRFPDDGAEPAQPRYFPPIGGFRFGLFTVPPDSATLPADVDQEAAAAELEALLPGVAEYMEPEPDTPGMHTTATIDYEYVVSGRCILELDDGERRELGPGDTVIQNGTRHAWSNPFEEECVVVAVLIGAHHDRIG